MTRIGSLPAFILLRGLITPLNDLARPDIYQILGAESGPAANPSGPQYSLLFLARQRRMLMAFFCRLNPNEVPTRQVGG